MNAIRQIRTGFLPLLIRVLTYLLSFVGVDVQKNLSNPQTGIGKWVSGYNTKKSKQIS